MQTQTTDIRSRSVQRSVGRSVELQDTDLFCVMCLKPATWRTRLQWKKVWIDVCEKHARVIQHWPRWMVEPLPNPKLRHDA